METLRNKSLQQIIEKPLTYLVIAQMLYILGRFLLSTGEALNINIPFYSPIGVLIGYGLLCLLCLVLSYIYDIIKFVLTAWIALKLFNGIIFFLIGPHFQTEGFELTVAPWEPLDNLILVTLIGVRIVLPILNKKYQLAYRIQVYFRLLKFKQYIWINRPLLK